MNRAKRHDQKRLILSLGVALAVHAGVFLAVELFDLIDIEAEAEIIGPMRVELSGFTSIPDTAEETGEFTESFQEEPVVEPVEEVEEPSEGESAELQPEGASPSEEILPADTFETAELERTETSSSYQVPEPETSPVPKEEFLFSGEDKTGEFVIEMGNTTDKAKPVFRIPVDISKRLSRNFPRAEVKLSFIVGPDGAIEDVYLDKSSGNVEIDMAVMESVLQWKFSNPFLADRIVGSFTYRIKP